VECAWVIVGIHAPLMILEPYANTLKGSVKLRDDFGIIGNTGE
jgi:hypothetical protein